VQLVRALEATEPLSVQRSLTKRRVRGRCAPDDTILKCLQDNYRFHGFTPVFIRDADHGDISNARVARKRTFDPAE
jgi:hypothetical protein